MVKTIDYEFPRGDTYALRKFRITDINNNVIELTGKDQLYFTVKTDSNSNKVLIQKRKDSGQQRIFRLPAQKLFLIGL